MAQQNSTLTLSTCQTATSVSSLEHESSPKHDVSLEQSKSAQQGFSIASWSDITAEELKAAGFVQRDAQYFPFTLAEVRALIMRQFQIGTLRDCFVVLDVSTPFETLYSFDRCPF